MDFEITRILQITAGEVLMPAVDAHAHVTGLEWDSRKVTPGCIYAALEGERVDGHDYVGAAIQAGATFVLCSHAISSDALAAASAAGAAVVQVADVTAAIQDIAAAWRDELSATVIGVTGSVGKTTTKGLIRDVLGSAYRTHATKGNFNNELGAPYTVLTAPADTQMLVVEMGMDRAGQIATLARMAKPDMGVVSIVGTSHLEYLGTRDGIALAKAELLDALPDGTGRAFLNAGCDKSAFMAQHARLAQRGVTCCAFSGTGEEPSAELGEFAAGAAVWAEDVTVDGLGRPAFTLRARGFGDETLSAPCTLSLRGAHNASNACAAVAVALSCGMSFTDAVAAVQQAQPEAGRAQVLEAACGAAVFNDAYNASPESTCAALATLAAYEADGRRIAVVGDMGELGTSSESGHARVGAAAAQTGVDVLICVGPRSRTTASAALEAGMPAEAVTCVDDAVAALAVLQGQLASGDVVLVKASHAMGLETVVEGIVE